MSYLNPSSVAGGTDRLDRSDVLVVDLDDTLVKTDIFVESSIRYLAGNVLRIFRFVLALLKGRSSAKSLIARSIRLDPSVLPYNHELLSYIEANYVTPGAKVILATATNQTFAHQIADHLGIFDGVIGSTDTANMKGKRKLVEIKKLVGENTWTYAGDSSADLPIWEKADRAITVNAPRRIEKRLSESGKVEKTFNRGHSMIVAFIRSLRVHQWSKNALIFVPLVASHSYTQVDSVILALLAFAAFCLCASGVYLLNDLVDIESDRKHSKKRFRPLASGDLPVSVGVAGAVALPAISLSIAWLLINPLLFVCLLCYLLINVGYSFYIKRIRTADVLTLAVLFTMRIVAGAVAIGVVLSSWLLAFSVFLFVSLAYLKRYIEVSATEKGGRVSGRGYRAEDCETMFVLGASNATASILVLALFVTSDDVTANYSSPELLWLLCFIMLYWTNRIWVKARSRQIDDDPIAFAIRDKISLVLGAASVVVVALAQSISI